MRFFITILSLITTSLGLIAQTDTTKPSVLESKPFTPEEAAKIAEQFAALQKEFEVRKKDIAAMALSRYNTAAQSEAAAVQFYFECQRMIEQRRPDLDGPDSRQETRDKTEQAKRQLDSIQETPGYGAVLQMQAQYLALTMEAPGMKDSGALMSRVRDFSSKAVGIVQTYTAPPEPERKPLSSVKSSSKRDSQKQRDARGDDRSRRQVAQLAQRGVMSTPFATAFSLQSYFTPLSGWSQSPLDLQGVYNGLVFPWYRANKPELLASEWDQYIRHKATLERCASEDTAYAQWLMSEFKTLQWSKWRDVLEHGRDRVMAADELAKLCRENPAHPAVAGWVQELVKLGESMKTTTAPAPSSEPPPAEPVK